MKRPTKKKGKRVYWSLGAVAVALAALWALTPADAGFKRAATWQRLASPGPLSAAHAALERDCAACHTSVRGVEPVRCIVCHANDESVLGRQPTSFHASVSSCVECHPEHLGRDRRPTAMDHVGLARLGLRQLRASDEPDDEGRLLAAQLVRWMRDGGAGGRLAASSAGVIPEEQILDCTTCHANDDRHFGLFGSDCAACHATSRWTIPVFVHPRSSSQDCAQCHQAPPSHYMKHFRMISQRVAARPKSRVDQCFQCHQTTSWPDIKRAGWYKHH